MHVQYFRAMSADVTVIDLKVFSLLVVTVKSSQFISIMLLIIDIVAQHLYGKRKILNI